MKLFSFKYKGFVILAHQLHQMSTINIWFVCLYVILYELYQIKQEKITWLLKPSMMLSFFNSSYEL